MNVYKYPEKKLWHRLATRPAMDKANLRALMADIFEKVQSGGDDALRFFGEKFDGNAPESFMVTDHEISDAERFISPELKSAMAKAKENIEKFHRQQQEAPGMIETTEGVFCHRENRAIEKIGIYIPAGSAPLFSTVLMLAVPAKIAGCEEIILCSPPDKNGHIAPAILFAAKICGVHKIFKTGGAQAVAAMSLGTETVPKVYKIFGPGNQYVTAAKEYCRELGTAIDMPAGPSEVLVIADQQAVSAFCAADLLAQAEHGKDSQVIFISADARIFDETLMELKHQLEALPRKHIAEVALQNSNFILIETVEEAIEFSNYYAPEHLILALENAARYTPKIKNAGSVFLGNFSCESAGDYASGTNHTLPTNGFARNYSGVSVDSFVKKITFQELTEKGLRNIGNTIETMAEAEGLFAHKNAVSLRLKALGK